MNAAQSEPVSPLPLFALALVILAIAIAISAFDLAPAERTYTADTGKHWQVTEVQGQPARH